MADLFEDKSQDWDSRPIPQLISEGVGEVLLHTIPWDPAMEIMDFGAGTGLITSHVAPGVRRVWAVDVSASMLEQLEAKDALEGRVETVCRDILAEPLARRFDGVVSAMAMHHVEDTERLLERFFEHLVPGGFVALADLDAEDGSFHPEGTQGVYHHGFDRESLARQLVDAGFVDPQFHTAVTLQKEERAYPVFVVTATKPNDG